MKEHGTSIALINQDDEVLLCLRDNNPDIPYPDRWDMLGGHIEAGENAAECIVRELREEIGYTLKGPKLFRTYYLDDRIEWVFWERADIDIKTTELAEGQQLEWFSRERIERMPEEAFAFGFRPLLLEFFKNKPF